jgi:hypothetical protein
MSKMIGARFNATWRRIIAVENRMVGIQHLITVVDTGMDGIARSDHRIEQMLTGPAGRLTTLTATRSLTRSIYRPPGQAGDRRTTGAMTDSERSQSCS